MEISESVSERENVGDLLALEPGRVRLTRATSICSKRLPGRASKMASPLQMYTDQGCPSLTSPGSMQSSVS
jgi:hypothetical protein